MVGQFEIVFITLMVEIRGTEQTHRFCHKISMISLRMSSSAIYNSKIFADTHKFICKRSGRCSGSRINHHEQGAGWRLRWAHQAYHPLVVGKL